MRGSGDTLRIWVRTLASFTLVLLFASLNDTKVVVQDGGNDRDHIGLYHTCPHCLGSPYADVHDADECQIPFEHLQLVLIPTLLEHAYQALDSAIDGENIPDPAGRCGEVCETVERVD
jgi:hypothetical protein